jgi:predicted small metal-binding protein
MEGDDRIAMVVSVRGPDGVIRVHPPYMRADSCVVFPQHISLHFVGLLVQEATSQLILATMARIITNRAELKRRRALMEAAIEQRQASRRLAEAAARDAAAHTTPQDGRGAPRATTTSARVNTRAPGTASHKASVAAVHHQAVAPSTSATGALDSAHAPGSKGAAWMREHGDAHKMTVVSDDDVNNSGARVWTIRCAACDTALRVTGAGALQKHTACAPHVAAVASGNAPESKVATWIRAHGDANKMTVVSDDEVNSNRSRVWTIRCAACDTALRVTGAGDLQRHTNGAHHAAVASGHAPESKVAAWMREHGDAHKMTVVSNDEINAGRHRVWTIRCAACDTVIRATRVPTLQTHAACAAHAGALDPAHAPETKVAAWMREHGDAHQMNVVSNDEYDTGKHRVWTIRCGACDTVIRAISARDLQKHASSASHAAALDPAHDPAHAPESKVAAWMREHGDAHKMAVVSNDEINSNRQRVWTIGCSACDTVLRVTGLCSLQQHVNGVHHAAAVATMGLATAHRGGQRKRWRS